MLGRQDTPFSAVGVCLYAYAGVYNHSIRRGSLTLTGRSLVSEMLTSANSHKEAAQHILMNEGNDELASTSHHNLKRFNFNFGGSSFWRGRFFFFFFTGRCLMSVSSCLRRCGLLCVCVHVLHVRDCRNFFFCYPIVMCAIHHRLELPGTNDV